ncbi:MAG: UDP-N-acetylglucosamine 1-carboxyvinyltransferase [Patescibacteria group bacterium]
METFSTGLNLLEVNISKFIIDGGKNLSGTIEVFGAKNAAPKMIAASIIINDKVTLHNIPDILDINKICQIIEELGAKITRHHHTLEIDTRDMTYQNPNPDFVKSMRSSVVLVGPLLARFGKVQIPHPGGDKIGSRPIDRHIKAFQELGVSVEQKPDHYLFINGHSLNKSIQFEKISVTGTENIILFATLGKKKITINNAAIEPEIIDLINFLNKAGADIVVQDRQITITGQKKLFGVEYTCIPDRIEAATFAVLAAASGSNLTIKNVVPEHLAPFLQKLVTLGVKFEINGDLLHIKKSGELKATKIETAEYPGFSTDWQPPLGVLLTQTHGLSQIKENVHENRLGYLDKLCQMGAHVKILNNHQAEISGPTQLHGAEIESLDIRAGATLIIAGLIAHGKTTIRQAEMIDRGYEKIEERLSKIGAEIKRVSE